jgi:ABC-type multidrug transport system, ATPase component
MENSLEVIDLTKKYSDFCLDHINFSLKQGSIMGFIGENGSGKTTTIKSILNLIKKDTGIINIFGMDMNDPKNDKLAKEQIGVVFDESHFHQTLNARMVNGFMSKLHPHWDEKLYYHYIDSFKLPKDKIVKDYSRGMLMKLSIAAALSHNPKLLILDEATSGLDPVVRNEILDVFFEYIQDEEHAILMSSHITSDLERICDYISFIHKGKLIFSKDKTEVIETHGILKCGNSDFNKIDTTDIIGTRKSSFGYEILIKDKKANMRKYKDFIIDNATLEDIMLFYSRGEQIC